MRTPRPLPPGLPLVFTVSDALASGVERSRLRCVDLQRPFRGIRVRSESAPGRLASAESPDEARAETVRLAHAYAARMKPNEYFSHTTAAILWDVPLPALADHVLDVSVSRPRRAPRSIGIRGHQIDPRLAHVTVRNGLRLTTPASTWAGLGVLLHPYDLVAAGDAIVCRRTSGGGNGSHRPPLAALEQLLAAIDAGRRPGIGALRDAFGRIRTDAWSRPETWVRLILVDAGLPEPVLNFDAYDDGGRFLGCVDLAYPDLRIAIEYEGAHHWMTAEQIHHDIDRLDRLVENGWRIVRLTKHHVFTTPLEVVRRVSVARGQRLATR